MCYDDLTAAWRVPLERPATGLENRGTLTRGSSNLLLSAEMLLTFPHDQIIMIVERSLHSSTDRAPASGAGDRGSNPCGGACLYSSTGQSTELLTRGLRVRILLGARISSSVAEQWLPNPRVGGSIPSWCAAV